MRRLKRYQSVVLAVGALIAAAGVLTFALHRDFVQRSSQGDAMPSLPGSAIVFTGQFDRVELGLTLLEDGKIERLFVSGVNVGAGITLDGFATQFQLSARLRRALDERQIILAPDANNTVQNALETACWLERDSYIGNVVLITSPAHMARASLALERAMPPGITVSRRNPQEGTRNPTSAQAISEFIKFGATWIITLLPRQLWSKRHPATCGRALRGATGAVADG